MAPALYLYYAISKKERLPTDGLTGYFTSIVALGHY